AAGEWIGQIQRLHLAHLALGAHAPDRAAVEHRQTGGVIAAILERLQADDQQRRDIALGNSGDNSTHDLASLVGGGARIRPATDEHVPMGALRQTFAAAPLPRTIVQFTLRRSQFNRSMRVIRPRKSSPSTTIATWPRSNTGSSDSIGERTSSRCRSAIMAVDTGSRKRDSSACTCSSTSDSSTMPTSLRPSITGSCDTSYSFMRL